MTQDRLQKILAHAGVASRRAAEEMIAAGRVSVDGAVVREAGFKTDPATADIRVDGKPIGAPERAQYWVVHKPKGYVSTVSDPQGRPLVTDLLPPGAYGRLYPVGRLDLDSEGLMLLTNDGELANRMLHPSFQVEKIYRVWVQGRIGRKALEALRAGVEIEGRKTAPARVTVKAAGDSGSKLSMVLTEGRKREVRLMCKAVGYPVRRLVRIGMGPLRLGELHPGEARKLTGREIAALRKLAGT